MKWEVGAISTVHFGIEDSNRVCAHVPRCVALILTLDADKQTKPSKADKGVNLMTELL